MSKVHITGPDDPRVSWYQSIRDPALVRQHGLFVAEGRLVVERLIREGRHAVQSLLVSEAACRALEPVLAVLQPEIPIYICDAGGLRSITGYDVHRGCLALAARPAPPSIDAVLQDARIVVVLEGVTNPDNVGGVFRNAAAFGADAVLLDAASCDPLYRKAIRTSMAAVLCVPFVRLTTQADEWPAALAGLKARGFTIAAFTPAGAGCDLDQLAASVGSARLALLFGSEGPGLSAASEAAAHHRVRISINPRVDSLNLAVAAGIALHSLSPVRQRAGAVGRAGSLGSTG